MVTTKDLLDLLKEKLGSDYKSAKALGITTQRIYKIRNHGGVFTDAQGLKAAEILNFPEETIILSLAAERSLNSPAFDILKGIADRYHTGKIAGLAILGGLGFFATLAPIAHFLPV